MRYGAARDREFRLCPSPTALHRAALRSAVLHDRDDVLCYTMYRTDHALEVVTLSLGVSHNNNNDNNMKKERERESELLSGIPIMSGWGCAQGRN